MRNISQMTAAIRAIRDNGGFAAIYHATPRSAPNSPVFTYWTAAAGQLSGQTIADLIADGWLKKSGDTLRITEFPKFAEG